MYIPLAAQQRLRRKQQRCRHGHLFLSIFSENDLNLGDEGAIRTGDQCHIQAQIPAYTEN